MNDLSRSVVVLLELDQIRRFLIEVHRRERVPVVGGLLEDGTRRIAVHSRLGRQRTNPLDQLAVAIGEAEPGTRNGGVHTDGLFRL